MVDLLVIGDANPDVIVGPLAEPLAFGQHEQLVGPACSPWAAPGRSPRAARPGSGCRSPSPAASVTTTPADSCVLALAERGVNTDALRTDPDLPTPLTVIVTRGEDRAMLTAARHAAATRASTCRRSCWPTAGTCMSASYFLMPALAASLPGVLGAGPPARRDHVTRHERRPGRGVGPGWPGAGGDRTSCCRTRREACAIAGESTVEDAAAALPRSGPTVVVKNGAAGALCHNGANVVCDSVASPVTPVDAVGAGDSFDAGFLAAKLRGASDQRALDLAAVCGALSTMAAGGTAAQPTWVRRHELSRGDPGMTRSPSSARAASCSPRGCWRTSSPSPS